MGLLCTNLVSAADTHSVVLEPACGHSCMWHAGKVSGNGAGLLPLVGRLWRNSRILQYGTRLTATSRYSYYNELEAFSPGVEKAFFECQFLDDRPVLYPKRRYTNVFRFENLHNPFSTPRLNAFIADLVIGLLCLGLEPLPSTPLPPIFQVTVSTDPKLINTLPSTTSKATTNEKCLQFLAITSTQSSSQIALTTLPPMLSRKYWLGCLR